MVNSISLISSSVCNLKCSFCFLNKNKSFNKYDLEILQAWKEKTYLSTVYKSLKKLKEDPLKIVRMEFWGGETLFHIVELKENINEIYKYFPNVKYFLFPTNWSINIKETFDFIQELDKYCPENSKLTLQLSIDGPNDEIQKMGHNISLEQYKKNIKVFANLINNTKLKNIKVGFTINATINKELYFKYLSDYEGIKNYISNMDDFINFMSDSFISESCEFSINHLFPGMASPTEETVEEGLKLANICRLWEYVRKNEFQTNSFESMFNKYFYFGLQHFNIENNCLNENNYCNQLKTALSFLPDGTILECTSSYISPNEDYQNECLENQEIEKYQNAILHKSNCFNPLIASEKEIKRFTWSVLNGIKNVEQTYKYFSMAICKELSKSGQLPEKYLYDKELLSNHLDIISGITTCTFENINLTKNAFLTSPSCFRRYLNGLTEYAYDNQKNEIKKQEIIYD